MNKLQRADNYNSILKILPGAGNKIDINTFSVDIEILEDVSINIEILIYDPFTNISFHSDPKPIG